MAFDDSLIGSNDFDPRTATEDLIRQQHDEPLPATLDPRMLNTRLARKLGQKPPKAEASEPENLDFSGFAPDQPGPVEPTPPSPSPTGKEPNLDFSGFAPAAPEPGLGISGNLKAAGKGVIHGAIEHSGSVLQGLGTAQANAQNDPAIAGMGSMADQFSGVITDPAVIAKQRADEERRRQEASSIENNALVKAGKAVKAQAQEVAPMTEAEKDSLGGRVGTGIGTIAPYAAATMLGGPAIGIAAGFTGMAASSYGDTFEAAKAKGVSDERANEAAGWAAATSGVLGSLPLGAGKLVSSAWAKIAASSVTFASLGEAQDALLQQIAKEYYDPEAGYHPEVKRIMASLIVGGLVGVSHVVADGGQQPRAPSGAPGGTPGALATAAGGGPRPGGGPRSSPEDINAFNAEARRTNPNPGNSTQTGTQSARPRDPATMDDAELATEFAQAREQMDGKSLEEILRAGGYAPDTIKHMSDRGKVEEAIGIARAYKAEAAEKAKQTGTRNPYDAYNVENEDGTVTHYEGKDMGGGGKGSGEPTKTYKRGQVPPETGPEATPEQPAGPEAPTPGAKGPDQPSHQEYAVLREYGYSDEDIANMSRHQRLREVLDAQSDGIDAKKAMAKYPLPAQPTAATGKAPDRGGYAGTREGAPEGTRESPIKATTQEDVKRAQPVEPKSPAQAQAENYQHAHLELPQFGLTGNKSISIETGVGQERKGVGPDGTPWSVKMTHGAYGRMKGTIGADGQPLDVMVGPHPTSPHVFVIDQHEPGKGFDEHKTMLGYLTPIDALHAYAHSYDDAGRDRIGGVTAMGAAEFEAWRNGDTTKPLMSGQSLVPEGGVTPAPSVAAEGAGVGSALTEASGEGTTSEVPKATVAGGGPTADTETKISEKADRSNEFSEENYGAIEQALGPAADTVVHADIARAAEILAQNEGMTPETAFGQAVIETGVEQGFITEQQAEQAYGTEVKDILESVGEGPSGGGSDLEPKRPASGEVGTGDTTQAGVIPGGGEAGKTEGTGKPGGRQDREQHDATGGESDTGGKTGGGADEEGAKPAEGADVTAGGDSGVSEHPYAKQTREATKRHHYVLDRATDERWRELIDTKLEDAHPGDIFRGVQLNLENGAISTKNARALMEAIEEEPLPDAEIIDILARSKIEKLQGGEVVQFPYKDENAQGRMWATLFGMEKGYIGKDRKPTKKLRDLIENPPPPLPEPEEQQKIEDAGAKIGGARKDAWGGRGLSYADLEGMTDVEKDKNLTKHNIWERPDYVQAVADGMDPVAAALVKRIYDRLPVKPNLSRHDADEGAKAFIKALNAVKDIARTVKTIDDAKDIDPVASVKLSYDERRTLYPAKSTTNPLVLDGADIRAAKRAVDAGFPEMAPWTRLFLVKHQTFGKPTWNLYRKNGGLISEHETKEAAETAAKDAYAKLSDERKQGAEEPKRPHLDHIMRSGPDYRGDRNVTGEDFIKDFGFHGVEFGNWVAGDERQKTVNFAYDALHDLARALGVAPKALSLGGRLSVGFGSRGRGGKAAAHYEAGRTVINMTKLSGAGALAHEYGHALDHYLGDLNNAAKVSGARSISGWGVTPKDVGSAWYGAGSFINSTSNRHLPVKLRAAVNRLMHDMFNVEEEDSKASERAQRELEAAKSSQNSWAEHLKKLRERKARGESAQGMSQAAKQVEIWGRSIAAKERALAEGVRKKMVPTNYLNEATKLSGATGDYWRRPNEMFARAFEGFVHDKIKDEGFESQYLVQGVEPNRFGNGFKGNPYPAGDERALINADFERVLRGIEVVGDRIQGAQGEPEPVQKIEKVTKPTPQPSAKEEAAAVEATQHKTLAGAFEAHFTAGRGFGGIIEARKFAKEAGFSDDQKVIEEAMELAIVRTARWLVEAGAETSHTFDALVKLYGRQPRLGTRTSTSVRDQAYSTPVPLAYLAARLAGITHETTVYEPTAGNGALLITADPAKVTANELNPERRANLRGQGFAPMGYDASTSTPVNQIDVKGVDRVIANPPFGPLKDDSGHSTVFDLREETGVPYRTLEIDHAIALKALEAMKDDGKAVLLLGGVNKLVSGDKARSDAYQGKAKREFFKALYDNYNVTDIFTVNGDLYERQGAGWPVDVVVINGRGKSSLSLPAVTPPRIYNDWASLGGLLDGQQATGGVQQAGEPVGGASDRGPGLGDVGGADRGRAGGDNATHLDTDNVRGERGVGAAESGARGGVTGNGPEGPRQGVEPAGPREQSSAVDDFDAAFDAALDAAYEPAPDFATPPPLEPTRGQKDSGVVDSGATTRSTSKVAKAAAENVRDAADEAFTALHKLFGGNKLSMGISFDEDTYQKAKPHFEAAANKFSEFKNNLGELLKRMVAHMRDALRWAREVMEEIRPYLKRFIDDMRAAPEERKSAIRPEATETENQVVYKPQSKVGGLNTLAPVNMAKPMSDSLARLEAKVGQIDTFVMNELGYTPAQLEKYFGAEQVDALGLAIDAIKGGKGFIIGDQTGIGKGRVNAAIIRWAIKNDRMPVFVTEKPNLYKDMFRDLNETGISDGFLTDKPRILATNAALTLPLEEGNGARIKTPDAKEHNAHMLKVLGDMPKHYDMVFTTYNQMQTQKGEDTARRQFLLALSNRPGGIVMIYDEAHNAGGQKGARKAKDEAKGRSDFARELIQKANGVFYSSATYAKRPEVMDLYSATDMAMAVDNIDDLAEAIQRGGIPMQQAVASMLAKAGQYVRRERSFAGINYNTPMVPVDRKTYDGISRALSAIQDLSKHAASAATRISAELRAEGGAMGADSAVGDAGASSTNFTAVMHNVINQMLLAMKANEAATRAIDAIKRGEKPVLTVANTMEAFLKDYADNLNLAPGDEMPGDFSHVLQKYLDRTRTVLIKKAHREKGEKPIRHRLTDDELGHTGMMVYNTAHQLIKDLDLAGLPISPIDYIKGQIVKAGYSVGEVTGRTLAVDYTGKVPVMSSRPGSEKTPAGRTKTIEQFNTRPKKGGVHALIINQAGSTGLSAHAGEKFDDQSKRRMTIVQPEANIDTHMQLLGRINRTGQVVLPEYDQLVADIPAEKRPAAVLAKKMASLNANTTASRSSAVTAKDVPDFINQYGDEIAASFVRDNLETNFRLASPLKVSDEGKIDPADAMRRLTGRLPLLPLEEQEAVYQHLESEYAALITQLEASGENALEAKSLDLKARLTEWSEVQGKRNDSGSPFAAPVILQKVSIARLGKPFKPAEIMSRLSEEMGGTPFSEESKTAQDMGTLANMLKNFNDPYGIWGKQVREKEMQERRDQIKLFTAYTRPILDEEQNAEQRAKDLVKFNEVKDRWSTIHQMVPIGRRVVVKTDTNNLTGIVLDVKQQGSPKNPLALGSWKVTFAIADASRQMTIPFSRLHENGKSNPDSALDVEIEPMNEWYERYEATLDKYQHMQNEAREDRYIAGGNMLAAYDWLDRKGSIINYTSYKGTVHQGILTPRGFNPAKQSLAHGKIERDPAKLRDILDTTLDRLWSKDGNIALQKDGRYGSDYVVTAQKAKNKGGAYYLDKQLIGLTGDFVSKGGNMVAYLSPGNFAKAVARMQALGAEFKVAAVDAAVNKVGEKKDQSGGGEEEPSLATIRHSYDVKLPPQQVQRVKSLVVQAVEKMVGKHAGVGFADGAFEMPGNANDGWGGSGEKAAAAYFPGRALIVFALDSNLETNIPHEVYHVVEFQLQTPEERALMERETPRIREGIRDYAKDKFKLDDDMIDRLAGEEVRAIGMEAFMEGRLKGAHLGVRRWYQRLWDMLRDLATKLRGMGYEKAEDIYGKVKEGFYREASGATPRPEADRGVALAAIRRTQNNAVSTRIADLMTTTKINKFVEGYQNLSHPVMRLQHAIEARMNGTLPDSQSFYVKKRLFPGKVAVEVNDFNKAHLDPLVKFLKANSINAKDAGDLMYALHAQERNEKVGALHPIGSQFHDAISNHSIVGASGMSTEEANDIIGRFQPQIVQQLRARVASIRDYILETMRRHGLESDETLQAWRDQYTDYVPLGGFEEAREEDDGFRESGKFNVRGPEVRKAFGRASKADSPLVNLMDQAYRTIERAQKNDYLRSLRTALGAIDPDDLKGFVTFDAGKSKRAIDPRTGLVRWVPDTSFHSDPKAVGFKLGGRTRYMVFQSRDLAEAIKRMHADGLGMFQGLLNLQNKIKSLWTHYSPDFLVRHFLFRYPIEGTLNSFEQKESGDHSVGKYAANAVPFLGHASKAIFASNKGVVHSNPDVAKMQRYWREMQKAGGSMTFRSMRDTDLLREHLEAKLNSLRNSPMQSLKDKWQASVEAMDTVTNALDNSLRLAAYASARDQGKTPQQAALIGREATVDFQQTGKWKNIMGLFYPFANVAIQTGARMTSAVARSKLMRRVFMGSILAGFLTGMFNYLVGGDDDDGVPFMDKIPEWDRHLNMIFMNPFHRDAKGRPVPIKIPMPYNWAFPTTIGSAMASMIFSKKDPHTLRKMLAMVTKAGVEVATPFGSEANLAAMVSPELSRPLIHAYTNKNWNGIPVHKDATFQKAPNSESGRKTTGDGWKYIASAMNSASGGDKRHQGQLDFYPEDLRLMFDYVLGSQSRMIQNIHGTASRAISGEPTDYTKIPLSRVFMGNDYDAADRARRFERIDHSKHPWKQ